MKMTALSLLSMDEPYYNDIAIALVLFTKDALIHGWLFHSLVYALVTSAPFR